jgi:hypothetical protein
MSEVQGLHEDLIRDKASHLSFMLGHKVLMNASAPTKYEVYRLRAWPEPVRSSVLDPSSASG